jgi:hypothetical protein
MHSSTEHTEIQPQLLQLLMLRTQTQAKMEDRHYDIHALRIIVVVVTTV